MKTHSIACLLLLSSLVSYTEAQTCAQVWNRQACDARYGGCSTCGRRINWLRTVRRMSNLAARRSVAGTFPEECGPCNPDAAPAPQPAPRPAPRPAPQPAPRPAPQPPADACAAVWNAQACDDRYGGCSTCGRRIEWLEENRRMSEDEARNSVAGTFPEECGVCATGGGGGGGNPAPAPRPPQPAPARPSTPSSGNTLKAKAQQRGIFYGAAVNGNRINRDAQLRAVSAREFNILTAENGCKHSWLQPNRGQYSWGQCDTVLEFAEANNMRSRGHALIWGNSVPGWLADGGFSGQQKRQLLIEHVSTVARRYGERFYCWDVVNEAVLDQPPNNGNGPLANNLKRNTWFPSVGDYIDLAFIEARKAAGPNVKLFYNDYNMAFGGGKVNAVYNMLKSMKDRNIPVDGMGLQLHIRDTTDVSALTGNVRRFASLGLEIHFTEITVDCTAPCDLNRQANMYKFLLELCLNTPNCKSFQTWGVTDKYIFNGADKRSLPWDENFNQKPAYRTLFNTL